MPETDEAVRYAVTRGWMMVENRHTAFALPKLVDRWLITANPRRPLIRFPSCFWVACGAAPAISKSCVVHDFDKGRIACAELVSDALDYRSHVRPIASISYPRDKPLVGQAVVDRAVGHAAARVRHQQMNDFVLTDGEADIP